MKKFLLFFMLCFSAAVFAQSENQNEIESVEQSDSVNKLKDVLKKKNIEGVKKILESANDSEIDSCEKLILEEAKKSVKKDDLDYAYSLSEIVLMNNFDNTEAQDLFTSIEKAKKSKAEVLAKEAEKEKKRKEEEDRLRQLEEYKKLMQQQEEERERLQRDISTITIKNFPFSFGLSPLVLDYIKSDVGNSYKSEKGPSLKYGCGVYADIGFEHPFIFADLHLNYDYELLSLAGDGQKSSFRTRLSAGSPIVSEFVRLSFGLNSVSYKNDGDYILLQNENAATIGFGLEKIKFGKTVEFSLFADINSLTFVADSKVDFGFSLETAIRYNLPFRILNKRAYLENITVFDAFLFSQNWETSLKTAFVFGVKINE